MPFSFIKLCTRHIERCGGDRYNILLKKQSDNSLSIKYLRFIFTRKESTYKALNISLNLFIMKQYNVWIENSNLFGNNFDYLTFVHFNDYWYYIRKVPNHGKHMV